MEAKLLVIIAAVTLIVLGNNQIYCVESKELVGGDGWHIYPDSPNVYSSSASKRTFSVGDTLGKS